MSRRRRAPEGRRRAGLGRPALLAVVALVLTGCSGDGDGDAGGSGGTDGPTTSAPLGAVQAFPVPSRNHVQGPIDYEHVPPVGGDHNAVWQNCGFYSHPVEPERAVHSLEHGAVWITYRPGLPADQLDVLRQLAGSRSHILVSQWADGSLPAPVVASAWGVQLKLESATDPALRSFIENFAGRGHAPEPGAACTGGFGMPEEGAP